MRPLLFALARAARNPRRGAQYLAYKAREALFWESLYSAIREPKVRGAVPHDPVVDEAIIEKLRENDFEVEELTVDLSAYEDWCTRAHYERFHAYSDEGRNPVLPEKSLEHYLAARLLDLQASDVYVDVASYQSPAPVIYQRLHGCTTFRQDMLYPEGLHGSRIGGDAAHMPVADGFATKLGLHNSFEHFEGESDVRFMHEAARVLRPGGRMCIVPLFLHDTYAVQTDPAALPSGGIPFEPDATIWCARGWRDRHGRFYDVPHLISRIRNHLDSFRMRIIVIANAREVHPTCYVRFAAVLERTS